jgi:beta-lactamase superfamily II metal-dependent hydrolase
VPAHVARANATTLPNMSVIKSFAVGFGDMFYIDHNSDNFTTIDCFLNAENTDIVLDQLAPLVKAKGISRFISTHPDDDHIRGLEKLEARVGLPNFYVVKNSVSKPDQTDSFDKYCELRDDAKKAFYISKGCSRKWMNKGDDERGSSGVEVLWPDLANASFQEALADAHAGESPNNMSAIVRYSLSAGASVMWLGDLHHDFMESIEDSFDASPVDVVFAPHHGRLTGRIPHSVLQKLNPQIIVIGEAATEHLHYYHGYNTITQNSAGDVIFDCQQGKVHVYTSKNYSRDYDEYYYLLQTGALLTKDKHRTDLFYIGSFNTHPR